jgi:O-antigen/teichoic acid export membrane protein
LTAPLEEGIVPQPVPLLGREAGVALRWNVLAAGASVFSQLAQILFLARWLTPTEFGLAAAALAVTAFVAGFADLGLTNALVQRENHGVKAWASAWWASAAAGAILCVVLLAAAPRVGAALHLEGMTPLLWVAAFSLPWFGPAAVFQAHLQRNLRLRGLAIAETVAAVLSLAVALAWAWWQPTAMALVAGQIALAVARFLALGAASTLRPALRLRWAELRPLAGFGGYQLAERITAHALANLDRLVVARLLGPAAAGFYFMASQIALKPGALLGPFTARILLPLLARMRGDRQRTASSYLRSMALLSLPSALIYALLFGLAAPLLALVLGPGWEPAVPVLRMLSVAGFLLVLGNALGNLALALGHAGIVFWLSLIVLVARIAAIAVGARYGLEGIAAALLIVTALSMPLDFLLPRLWLGIDFGALARAGGWTLLPAVVSAAGTTLLTARLALPPLVETLLGGAAGCLLFALAAWLFHRNLLRTVLRELADKLARK